MLTSTTSAAPSHVSAPPVPTPDPLLREPLRADDSRSLGLALLIASVGVFWCSVGAMIGWVAHRALTP